MSGPLLRILGAGLAMLVVAGCYAGPGGSTGTASADPGTTTFGPTGTPSDSGCGGINESIDAMDPTLENLKIVSKDVVVATIDRKGSAFWNSATGLPPTVDDKPGPSNLFGILTPYDVTVENAVTGARGLGNLTIVIEGGEVDCFIHSVSPAVQLQVKGTYLLFLSPSISPSGTARADLPLAFEAFPVQADGTVLTPLDGAQSIAAVTSALAQDSQSSKP